jgi:acyl-CoA synthetase (AMP-forming)/AMP-acid ligase II
MLTVGFCRVDGLVLESISRLSTRRESQSIPGSLVQWALEVRTSCGVTGTIQKVLSMRFTNGMFRAGDIGYQDSDGYCYILDRLKDYGCTQVRLKQLFPNIRLFRKGRFSEYLIPSGSSSWRLALC